MENLAQKYAVSDVVPHARTMILIDQLIEYSADSLSALVEVNAKSLFVDPDGVPAWVGIEYMAQTVAAWAGINAKEAGEDIKLGFLLGTRKYESFQTHFPLNSRLTVSVKKSYQADELGVFECAIHSEELLAKATLNVYQPTSSEVE